MSTFVSEILVLVGTFPRYPAAAVAATVGVVLAALYILLTYQRMCTGPVREHTSGWRDMSFREAVIVAPLIAALVGLGVYPKPVLDVVVPGTDRARTQVQTWDPQPEVPAPQQPGGSR